MNKVLAIAAVAGIASTASAQSLVITADVTEVGIGGLITWTVAVTGITNANHFLSGYDLNFIASDNSLGLAGAFVTNLSVTVNPTPGVANGADLNVVSGGQSTLLDGTAQFGNVVIGTFTVVAGAEGVLSYGSVSDGGFLAGTTGIRTRNGSDFGPIVFNAVPQVASDSVNIIPTPATAALLGLGGLVANRRRR